jgi:hypothetical protein
MSVTVSYNEKLVKIKVKNLIDDITAMRIRFMPMLKKIPYLSDID